MEQPPAASTRQGALLAIGEMHVCAVFGDVVRCWGWNGNGELGNGTTTSHYRATLVPGLSGVFEVAAGEAFDVSPDAARATRGSHTCARLVDGSVRCWGPNVNGQGEPGTTASRHLVPTVIPGLQGAAQIAVGKFHTCVLMTDGTVRCWGDNSGGEVGTGSSSAREDTPVAVVGLTGATQIAANFASTCALLSDGTVRCWGLCGTQACASPAQIAGLTRVIHLGGRYDICATRDDGSAACWGRDDWTPHEVVGLASAAAVFSEAWHACALMVDGSVQCWGRNGCGQLGDGTLADHASPMPVPGLTDVVDVRVGSNYTCARRRDDVVMCWGINFTGQLGDGTTATRKTPAPVQLEP